MKKIVFFIFFLSTALFNIHAQVFRPFAIDNYRTANMSADIRANVDDAFILSVNNNDLEQIVSSKSSVIALNFPVSEISSFNVNMQRFDIMAAGSKIVEGTDFGDKGINISNEFVSYIGSAPGIPKSKLVCIFFRDYASAILMTPNETYVMGKIGFGNSENNYILYESSKLKMQRNFVCGSDAMEIPQRISEMQKSLNINPRDYSSSNLLKADIAIESDFDTYTHFNSSLSNTTRYLLSLMTMVSGVYVKDVNVQLYISYLRVWTTSNDPYTGTTSFDLLSEFRSYWNSNMQSVPRTIAHYVTTRPGGLGGVAWVGVLCASVNSGYGYAFSDIDGTYNYLPVYSWDVDVVSHETGHNFGSPHTHNCSWSGGPIDTCYVPVEGGCYTGPAIPRIGTIMSYCHLNSSKVLSFGPQPTQLIRNSAESAPCISNANFFVAVPNGGEIFRAGENRMIIWGTSITSNVNVEYSSNNGSSWNTIQNNVPAVNRNITWQIPLISTTTQARVRVYESGNPANGDLCDSVFQIRPAFRTFSLVSPPLLSRFFTSSTDTSVIYFIWTKAGTLPEIKYKWNLSTFDYIKSISRFSNNAGADSVFSIRLNTLDSIISSWGVQVGDSLRGRWWVKAYSQLDSAGSQPTNFLITLIRQIVGIKPISSNVPKEFFVNPNYPNPFNPETKIKFGLPLRKFVKLVVYNALGKEVEILVNNNLEPGVYEASWNAENYPSGVYFFRVEADGEFEKSGKMILLK